MEISVDISLYPLKDEYIGPIINFISAVEKNANITVVKNSLSTQVFGEYKTVMSILEEEIFNVFDELPHSVIVLKMVGNNRLGA
jgi:uncharacterized protein YqgV (UPF0045/DUF77 family)